MYIGPEYPQLGPGQGKTIGQRLREPVKQPENNINK
jgi:hypothetical protein